MDEDLLNLNPFERRNGDNGSRDSGDSAAQQGAGIAAGGINVSVNLSPVIQIEGSGMNEEEVFKVMKSRIRECADDVGMEVGERLSKIFGNMPLAQGV